MNAKHVRVRKCILEYVNETCTYTHFIHYEFEPFNYCVKNGISKISMSEVTLSMDFFLTALLSRAFH